MKHHYIEVLKTLEEEGIGIYKDLSPILIKMFPLKDKSDAIELHEQVSKVKALLESMSSHITLKQEKVERIIWGYKVDENRWARYWLDTIKIEAYITASGMSYLSGIRSEHLTYSVSQSVKDTNKATKVLYERQNRVFNITLTIGILGVCVAIASVFFSGLSYFRDSAAADLKKTVANQQSQLNHSQIEVKRLQQKLDSLYKLTRQSNQAQKVKN